jgi:hypothetical protein
LQTQKHQALPAARKLLREKAIAIANDIRGLLRNCGLKVGLVGKVKFDDHKLVEDRPYLVRSCQLHGKCCAKSSRSGYQGTPPAWAALRGFAGTMILRS